MAQEGLLQRRCHNNLNLTSPTSYFSHTSRAKTPFSSCQDGPKTLPNGPEMAPRRAKIAPKWPKITQAGPKMAQDGSLKRRRHNSIELIPPTSHFLHTSRAKTPFSSCQDGPEPPPNGAQMAPRRAKIAPKWPKITLDGPKMPQDSPPNPSTLNPPDRIKPVLAWEREAR